MDDLQLSRVEGHFFDWGCDALPLWFMGLIRDGILYDTFGVV